MMAERKRERRGMEMKMKDERKGREK